MNLVPRETAIGAPLLTVFRRCSFQLSERIETLELQAAIVAKQLMQPGHLEDNRRVIETTLNAGTLATRAPHIGFLNLGSDFVGALLRRDCRARKL